MNRLTIQSEPQGGFITIRPQTNNDTASDVREIGAVTERLTTVNIGQMNFNKRNTDTGKCIPYRYAGMGIGTSIDQDEIDALGTGLMNSINEPAFVIALKKMTLRTMLVGQHL